MSLSSQLQLCCSFSKNLILYCIPEQRRTHDSHQHFWYYHPEREGWIDDSMSVIRKDFLPQDLKPVLDKNQIEGCIAVEANDSEEESEFLLEVAANYSFVKGVVGWVDLSAENCTQRLSYFAKNPFFKGIRHTVQAENENFILRKDFQNGVSQLSKFNLSYDLLVYEYQLPAAIKLVKKFPNQRFVLDHMAKPPISKGLSKQWVDCIRELSSCGNVYCKLSGLITETENFKWSFEDFTPFLEVVANAFGEDKLMFGSDWPVCIAAGKYEDTIKIVKDFFLSRGEIVLEKIMGKNAIAFYKL